MGVRRGDVVIVSVSGDYGKPRPAVVIQADAFCDLQSVVVALMTSDQREDVQLFRKAIEPTAENGLRLPTDVMVDKVFTFSREKLGEPIGALTSAEMDVIGSSLVTILGL